MEVQIVPEAVLQGADCPDAQLVLRAPGMPELHVSDRMGASSSSSAAGRRWEAGGQPGNPCAGISNADNEAWILSERSLSTSNLTSPQAPTALPAGAAGRCLGAGCAAGKQAADPCHRVGVDGHGSR